MDFTTFLSEHVDGYLLSDIRSLQGFRISTGSPYGWLGYPLAITTLAGVELFGTLGAEDPHVNFGKGEDYFAWFWTEWMYRGGSSDAVPKLIYTLLRDGLAHTFVGKPGVTVTRFQRETHLTCPADASSLHVDADALSEAFVSAQAAFRLRIERDSVLKDRVALRFSQYLKIVVRQAGRHAGTLHALRLSEQYRSDTRTAILATTVSSPAVRSNVVLSTSGLRP